MSILWPIDKNISLASTFAPKRVCQSVARKLRLMMKRLLALGLALSLIPIAVSAKPSMSKLLAGMNAVTSVSQSAIAPDGSRVAWAQTLKHKTTLWVERPRHEIGRSPYRRF